MHICLIPPYSLPSKISSHGGIGSFTNFYTELLLQSNHKVTIIESGKLYKETKTNQVNNLTVIQLKSPKIPGFKWLINSIRLNKEIFKIHNSSPIDCVETAEQGLAFILKKKSINYVIRLHGGHHFFSKSESRKIKWWSGFQEKVSFKKADAFIAVSNFVKEHTNTYLSYNSKSIVVLPSPINSEKFSNKNDIKVIKNKLVFAGRLCEKKGLHNLINAMPRVKIVNPKIELYIFGKDSLIKESKTSYKAFLQKEVLSKIGNHKEYIFFNEEVNQEKLIKELCSAEVCVFPSLMETQGLIALEAMSLKKVVIFTKYGPGKELINHGENGVLCDSYDYNSIADEIIWCLNLNKQERNKIEIRARETILNEYDSNTFLNNNIKFYKSLK